MLLLAGKFLWSCLDFQKQGYLDKFTLDFFLRDLAAKVHAHRDEEEDDSDSEHDTAAFIKRVRVSGSAQLVGCCECGGAMSL